MSRPEGNQSLHEPGAKDADHAGHGSRAEPGKPAIPVAGADDCPYAALSVEQLERTLRALADTVMVLRGWNAAPDEGHDA